MSDRTPVEQLSGPILCERTAEAMGWKRKARMDNEYGKWWTDKNGKDRRIRSVNAPYECSFDFRPDLDGNHLAEVMAEIERREKWDFQVGYSDHDYYCTIYSDLEEGRMIDHTYEADSFNDAILLSFVAASEAEREAEQNESHP